MSLVNPNDLKQLLDDKLSRLSDKEKEEIKINFSQSIQLQKTAHQILINSIKLALDCGISRNEIILILDTELSDIIFRL